MNSAPVVVTNLSRSSFPHNLSRARFPEGFVFGAATAAYQVEGAANLDGRGPSLWDVFAVQKPENIDRGSNGNVAVDQYHRYKEDVAMMKKIGLDAYRLSISWSRVLPGGRLSAGVNKEGVEYYNNLIDELLKNGIQPYVTIFHWDVPQALEEEYGGFLDRKIIEDFREFADLCFWEFGDRVKNWITLNEPWSFATGGYAGRGMAPGRGEPAKKLPSLRPQIDEPPKYRSSSRRTNLLRSELLRSDIPIPGDSGTEPYTVAHNLILAHAEAYHLYNDKYKSQGGRVGITLVSEWWRPYDPTSNDDKKASQRAVDFFLGWFMSPITYGKYPDTMTEYVKERLPKFTGHERKRITMSYDFLGLNYYTAKYVKNRPGLPTPPFHYDYDAMVTESATNVDCHAIGEQAGSDWLYVHPTGIFDLLRHVQKNYKDPHIYITENGYDEKNQDDKITLPEAGEDPKRISYIHNHLGQIWLAIHKKVKVKGYFYWALIDNYEWAAGYSVRFGLIYADYHNNLARYPKHSALWFMNFLNNGPAEEIPVGTKRPNSGDADETPVQKQSRGN